MEINMDKEPITVSGLKDLKSELEDLKNVQRPKIVEVIAEVIEYGIPIVVDDGSTDQTVYLARDAGATVISHSVNLGYDAALESGFINANRVGCDFALTIDADGQQDPIFLPIFLQQLPAAPGPSPPRSSHGP